MTRTLLPFEVAEPHQHDGITRDCPIYEWLPEVLREDEERRDALWDYLHMVPLGENGIPEYYEKPGRDLGDLENPNVIYPAGKRAFVHIYPDRKDARDFYIPVEPGMGEDLSGVMPLIDSVLADHVGEMEGPEGSEQDRIQSLLKILARVCTETSEKNRFGLRKGVVGVTEGQFDAVAYHVVRDKFGMGLLDPLINDPYIEDISCSGVGRIFVEHKIFKGLKTSTTVDSFDELDRFVIRLAERIGKPVTFRNPILDATLPDGSRVNIVYGGDLSQRGSNFTIRKFTETPLSILQLIDFHTLSYEMAAYLSLALGHGMNMFIAGETASGKTTLINALTTFIPPDGKIVSIEDTPELQIPHPNWTKEVVRATNKDSEAAAIGMFDLLKAALRQRPDQIIIGEIRGEEGAICFQAMQTGHPAMATFHADSPVKLIQRLTGSPINIPKLYIDNLNLVVIQGKVRLPDGRDGRRVLSISEIVNYDPTTDSFSIIDAFTWNPDNDTFEFTGFQNSFLLEDKIATRRGIASDKKMTIYDEVARRAEILKEVREQGKVDFFALYQFLSQSYREKVFY